MVLLIYASVMYEVYNNLPAVFKSNHLNPFHNGCFNLTSAVDKINFEKIAEL